VIRGEDGRIARVCYVLPRHKAANWVGPGRARKSTRPGAKRRRRILAIRFSGQALGPRAAAAKAAALLRRRLRSESQAQACRPRHAPSVTVARCEMPRLVGMRSAEMRRAEMPPAVAIEVTSPAHTKRPGSPGPNSWPGWARSFHSSARGAAATSGSSPSSPSRVRFGRSSRI
jgi:hypothetical protein